MHTKTVYVDFLDKKTFDCEEDCRKFEKQLLTGCHCFDDKFKPVDATYIDEHYYCYCETEIAAHAYTTYCQTCKDDYKGIRAGVLLKWNEYDDVWNSYNERVQIAINDLIDEKATFLDVLKSQGVYDIWKSADKENSLEVNE